MPNVSDDIQMTPLLEKAYSLTSKTTLSVKELAKRGKILGTGIGIGMLVFLGTLLVWSMGWPQTSGAKLFTLFIALGSLGMVIYTSGIAFFMVIEGYTAETINKMHLQAELHEETELVSKLENELAEMKKREVSLVDLRSDQNSLAEGSMFTQGEEDVKSKVHSLLTQQFNVSEFQVDSGVESVKSNVMEGLGAKHEFVNVSMAPHSKELPEFVLEVKSESAMNTIKEAIEQQYGLLDLSREAASSAVKVLLRFGNEAIISVNGKVGVVVVKTLLDYWLQSSVHNTPIVEKR